MIDNTLNSGTYMIFCDSYYSTMKQEDNRYHSHLLDRKLKLCSTRYVIEPAPLTSRWDRSQLSPVLSQRVT